MGNELCGCLCLEKVDNKTMLKSNKNQPLSVYSGTDAKMSSTLPNYYTNGLIQTDSKQSDLADKNNEKNHRNISKNSLEARNSIGIIENSDSIDNQESERIKVCRSDVFKKDNQADYLLQNNKKSKNNRFEDVKANKSDIQKKI